MPQENYILSVYNTISGKVEEIEVSEADYNEYRRGGWCIDRSNRRFREKETPFTDLKGGLDGAYENFDEFRSEQDDPAQLVVNELLLEDLRQALACLTDAERELLHYMPVQRRQHGYARLPQSPCAGLALHRPAGTDQDHR